MTTLVLVLVWLFAVPAGALYLVVVVAVGAVHLVAGGVHRGTGWILDQTIALADWANAQRKKRDPPGAPRKPS
jgi:hypothetical protein